MTVRVRDFIKIKLEQVLNIFVLIKNCRFVPQLIEIAFSKRWHANAIFKIKLRNRIDDSKLLLIKLLLIIALIKRFTY